MKCVWEHNGNDTLLYSVDYIGAYTRGDSLGVAMSKMNREISSYCTWSNIKAGDLGTIKIVQEKISDLSICDADSDVLFESEKEVLTLEEYKTLKALALKSAKDFYELYFSIRNKDATSLPERKTFYGIAPRTAQQMYDHTKNVNAYYFGEIGIVADNEGTIVDCRMRGFESLENKDGFLHNAVVEGSYGELWTLRKVLRRFVWHDRIHAKAMYRMAVKTFGALGAENIFYF
jgi:hypothetical protein